MPVTRSIRFNVSAILWAALFLSPTTHAQLPTARLSTIFPPGGQTGTTVEITISGTDLDSASSLLFSHPSLFAKPRLDEKNNPVPNQFIIAIPSNAPLGTHDLRVVGRFGATNPRAFAIDALPEKFAASNNSPATAVELPLNTLVNARSTPTAIDHYRFTASRGQRIFIDADSREIDSRAELSMALYDPAGRELERSRRSGFIDFTAPADAQYLLKIHDSLFRGGPEYAYRLSLRTTPRIDSIFPPIIPAGGKTTLTLFGRNLPSSSPSPFKSADGKPLEQLSIELDRAAPSAPAYSLTPTADLFADAFHYRLRTPSGSSNPALITSSPSPVVLESDKNDQPAEAQRIAIPCELAGRFFPRRDHDWVRFEAKKGDIFWIEVLAHRAGVPSDPFLLVQRVTKNDKGEETVAEAQEVYDTDTGLATTELRVSNRDPALRLEAKEDSTYRVMVRDLFNVSTDDPSRVYRLSIRKPTPDFRLAAIVPTPLPPKDSKLVMPWSLLLRRAGTIPLKVTAQRRDGFNEPIDLQITGLPKGVTATGTRIEPGASTATIMLTAAEDSPTWAGQVSIAGSSTLNNQYITHSAVPTTLLFPVTDPGAEPLASRAARDLVLAVIDSELDPLTLAAGDGKPVEVPANAKIKVPIKVGRRGEFTAALKLKPIGPGGIAAVKEIDLDPKSAETSIEIDPAALKLPPGQHAFYLYTQTAGKYQRHPEAFDAAASEQTAADKLIKDLQQQIKTASETRAKAEETSKSADAAVKAASDALAALATTVADEKTAAQKALDEKTTVAKAATEALAAAKKSEADFAAQLKTAEARKAAADAKRKELTPKDVTATFYSNIVTLKVLPPATQPAK